MLIMTVNMINILFNTTAKIFHLMQLIKLFVDRLGTTGADYVVILGIALSLSRKCNLRLRC